MGFLSGKKILVTGVASNRSIAWGCAEAMHREGAEIALTYQNDKLKSRVEDMAAKCDSDLTFPLDVGSDSDIEALFAALAERWDGLDGIVHSVAFAPREQLEGDYVDAVTREGFATAHDISSYSFAALAKASRGMMQGRNGALVTMTYLGAVRAVPNYNVMGVAKASLEANMRYLAASLGPHGHARERRLRRSHPHPCRSRDLGFSRHAEEGRGTHALAAQRHDRGGRECCRLPLLGSGERHHRRRAVRRYRLPHPR
jgi:enoyl-[acyl-carrier protein] reductase I